MFTKRHENELAEIKALTSELGQRFDEVLEQLEDIKKVQGQLVRRDQGGQTRDPDAKVGKPKAQRKAERFRAMESGQVAGGKKARSRQRSTAVGGEKPGKRQRVILGSSAGASEGDAAPKRRGRGGRKRARSEPIPGAGSDEEQGPNEEQPPANP